MKSSAVVIELLSVECWVDTGHSGRPVKKRHTVSCWFLYFTNHYLPCYTMNKYTTVPTQAWARSIISIYLLASVESVQKKQRSVTGMIYYCVWKHRCREPYPESLLCGSSVRHWWQWAMTQWMSVMGWCQQNQSMAESVPEAFFMRYRKQHAVLICVHHTTILFFLFKCI